MTKKNEVVVVNTEMPAYLQKINKEDTRGSEGVGQEDLIIPRLGLVQALSPEIKKSDPQYIEGIEQGQLFNTVTRKIYGDSVMIVPVLFDKPYLLWRDRDLGGGFGGQYPTQAEAEEAIQQQEKPDGWEVADTPTHICLLIDGDDISEIAIPMPRSKAKVSRQLNSIVRMLGGPRFSRVYTISGIGDKNNKNQDFHNFKVDQAGFPAEEIYLRAEKFYEEMSSGDVSYKMDDTGNEASEETEAF